MAASCRPVHLFTMADPIQQLCSNGTAEASMAWSDAMSAGDDAVVDATFNATACANASAVAEMTLLGPKTPWLKQLQILTYSLSPQELYIPSLQETPDFFIKPLPLVLVLMVFEAICKCWMGRKEEVQLNNYVVNFNTTAVLDSFTLLMFRGAELVLYNIVYDNFRIFTLPWDSFYTYVFAFIFVDYCAYWYHRESHEIALLWASHEYHHNSEDLNLSVAMRLPFTLRFFKWIFNMPMALIGLPVQTMFAHTQLGFIYNGLNHLSVVPSIGKMFPYVGDVFEYFFVTPKHHRVHHAMNEYAIDTNYGNVLIIFDRIHGTFAEERLDEKLSYGTLTPLDTSSVIQLQHAPFEALWWKAQSMDKFTDKVKTFFYGPGWFPGRPRLGLKEELPDMRGRPKWEVKQPLWVSLYLLMNGVAVFAQYLDKLGTYKVLSDQYKYCVFANIYFSYWALGGLYDYKKWAIWMELLRIVGFLGVQTLSSYPLVVVPHFYTLTLFIACLSLLIFPFVAKHVTERIVSGPSDQELYQKKLERFKYVKPKFE